MEGMSKKYKKRTGAPLPCTTEPCYGKGAPLFFCGFLGLGALDLSRKHNFGGEKSKLLTR